MRTPTEEHVAAVKHDVGMMTAALYRISQGVENPRDAAYEALCAVGADELAMLSRAPTEEQERQPDARYVVVGSIRTWDASGPDLEWEYEINEDDQDLEALAALPPGRYRLVALAGGPVPRAEPETDEEEVRCTCGWAHPVDGGIDASWPAELDPRCPAHGTTAGRAPESEEGGENG